MIRNRFALVLLVIAVGGVATSGWLIWRAYSALPPQSPPWTAFIILGCAVLALWIDAERNAREQAASPAPGVNRTEVAKNEPPVPLTLERILRPSMSNRLLWTTTLLFVGFTVGAILGRRWVGSLADSTLTLIALLTVGLVILVLMDRLRKQPAGPALQETEPQGTISAGHRLSLAVRDGGLALRLVDIGRLRFFEISLALPGHWAAPLVRAPSLSLLRSEGVVLLLFVFALCVYALTRLHALEEFPIYFFTDEAIHPVLASDLIRNGFHDAQGNLFPIYFQNGLYWNLSLSVYLHALTVALFGKTIWVTRATSAIISLFGVAAVGLILKWFLNARWWWLVVLFLTVTPAWFLHSRTAFETVLMVSFYVWFLLFYLLYRYRSPRWLYPALIFGAAAFYSYSIGQAVMAASGLLFLISDWRYHWKNWRTGLIGVALLGLLAFPYLFFRWQNPEAVVSQLRILESYWLKPLPLDLKVQHFLSDYAYGLSPQYWFLPNDSDLVRHRMKDYGNISWWVLPLVLVGLWGCLRRFRSSPAHRAVLIAALAGPFGSALADISITRALLFVVPANILALLGFETLVGWAKSLRAQWTVAMGSALVLSLLSLWMLRDALTNGPTWYKDYGLFGIQWGARQLFTQAIPDYISLHPLGTVYLTPTWANGTDVFLRFFPTLPRLQIGNVDRFIAFKQNLDSQSTLIMTWEELDRARASGKFKPDFVDKIVPYPDGRPGFFFTHLSYVDNIDEIFAAERQARQKLVTDTVTLNGEPVIVAHSVFDGGTAQDMFDGDPYTLARGLEANPLVIEMQFAKPRAVSSLDAIFAQMNFKWTILLYADDASLPVEYSAEYSDLPGEPHVTMKFDEGAAQVSKIHIEILQLNAPEPAHIHVRELVLH